MADFKPTKSQQKAIEERNGTILVSAGAGSGKTKVLTERLMLYVCGPEKADIDEFVVITFTNAAAAELRAKIAAALREKAAELQGKDAERLRRQEALLSRAHIGTIHHFCASILRANAHAAELSPDFKIMSEERANELKRRTVEKLFDSCYENMDSIEGFEELVNTLGSGRNDSKLVELVLSLHERIQCQAKPEEWTEYCRSLYKTEGDISNTLWGREILSEDRKTALRLEEKLQAMMEEMARCEKISAAYMQSYSDAAAGLREYARCLELGWDRALECPLGFPKLGILRNSPDAELSERAKALKKDCAAEMKKLKKHINRPSSKTLEEIGSFSATAGALLELTLKFGEKYAAEKRRMNCADYSDLEHFAADFLEKHDISSSFREIMVDEYQDVSRIQDRIFSLVSGGGEKLFLVGDVKQSIYRFRLADPEIFLEKSRKEGVKSIPLKENFRSRKEIIDCVNSIFNGIMTEYIGDVDYENGNGLVYGASYYDGTPCPGEPELFIVEREKGANAELAEADFVAEKIRDMVDRGEARYSEIAVLLRSPGKQAPAFRTAFAQRGIPAITEKSDAFFSFPEISDLISVLRTIDNPRNDIALIAALSSPLFGFSPDELSLIKLESSENREEDFYDALCRRAAKDEKCAAFLGTLEKLAAAAPDMTMERLIRRIMGMTDGWKLALVMPDGQERQENISQLISIAANYEKDAYHGLHRFLLYLDGLKEKGIERQGGEISPAAVRIMSVHKSKGLQFKTVFLCGTARRFNESDSREQLLVHSVLGFGPKYTDRELRAVYSTAARSAIAARQRRELRSEEMRLLYVALTRAEEQLIITGCAKEPEKIIENAKIMAPEDAGCFLDWVLMSGALEPKIERGGAQEEKAEQEPEKPRETEEPEELSFEEDLSFEYPHRAAEKLPSKLTATELKNIFDAEESEGEPLVQPAGRKPRMPSFTLEEKPLSAAERGIATHKCLQFMDFSKNGSSEEIEEEIERLGTAGFLSDREAKAVNSRAVLGFLNSPVGLRIREAKAVHREFRFSILCKAEELLETGGEEQILLQGVVDCCIEEEGKLVIIDYKTDSLLPGEQTVQRAERYSEQLRAYALALGRIFQKEVSETVLYFLSNGEWVSKF